MYVCAKYILISNLIRIIIRIEICTIIKILRLIVKEGSTYVFTE